MFAKQNPLIEQIYWLNRSLGSAVIMTQNLTAGNSADLLTHQICFLGLICWLNRTFGSRSIASGKFINVEDLLDEQICCLSRSGDFYNDTFSYHPHKLFYSEFNILSRSSDEAVSNQLRFGIELNKCFLVYILCKLVLYEHGHAVFFVNLVIKYKVSVLIPDHT